jgi:CRISPR-associated protein Cas1
MRQLLNTLYVLSPDRYAALDGENIVLRQGGDEVGRIPLHNLEGVVMFGYTGASPALMGECAERGIGMTFLTMNGKFLCRVSGEVQGNVLLRKTQYRTSDDENASLGIAKMMIAGKLYNQRSMVERAIRDHPMRVDVDKLSRVSGFIKDAVLAASDATTLEELRGFEGEAAARYFAVFDDLILQQKDYFVFDGRNKRPPLDNVNALLSFAYTLLSHECSAALSSVGLDPYVGFLHRDRPGRSSLALDMMEELRAVLADRFVLTLINNRVVNPSGFTEKESGAVIMDKDTRSSVLSAWQTRKQEELTHPFLKEKIKWGLVPYAQSLLLARYLRGDLDAYPPFMWK